MKPSFAALSTLICLAAPLPAQRVQSPDAPWRTIRTAHYRIHYPQRGDFEPFALEVASKIEGIHAQVAEWVGYASPRTVDVLIRDPRLEGNGTAYPFLRHPFVELWKTPPEPDSAIGHFTTWPELLVTHELTHIHHLMRPQQDPKILDRLLPPPVGPLTVKAPRWVIEGYATVIEGRVTGSGRPHGAYRAALLRQWAREGKLPDYGALNGFEGFRGGGMAYLVGSAYLEWLERHAAQGHGGKGEQDVLKKLWRKLAEGRDRKFDDVFLGTFGFTARDGYDRFRAELAADALGLEQRMDAQQLRREGEVFSKVDGEITELAVDPSGTWLLARVLTPKFKGLRIWNLKKGPKPRPRARHPKTADPDIAPALPVKKADWELGRNNGLIPEKPHWAAAPETAPASGGPLVSFSVREPDGEGVLRRRMKTWRPASGRTADAQPEPRPAPDLAARFQVRDVDGLRSIWTLPMGGIETPKVEAPALPAVRTASAAWLPAPAPDGKALYYAQLGATGCEIRKLDLTLPPPREAPIPWGGSMFALDAVKPRPDELSQLPPPVEPPQAHDYSARESMWPGLRSGLTLAPAGKSYELGFGGMDQLGRLSWQVLAAAGDLAGPRGAMAGLAWRGWRWAPSFHVFSSLERPSRQQFVPVPGFDRQRTGGEAALTFETKGTTPAFFKPTLAVERVEFKGSEKPDSSRRLVGLELGLSHAWSRGEAWGFRLSARAQDGAGRTNGNDWRLQRGQVQADISTPWWPLALKAESGRVLGGPTPLDRFHLGGLGTSLVPAGLDWNRIAQPALPAYGATGDRLRRFRAEVGAELRAYLEHTVVWDQGKDRPAYTRVAGVEIDFTQLLGGNEAISHLLGRVALVAGIHRVLGGADPSTSMKDRTVGTLSLVVRP